LGSQSLAEGTGFEVLGGWEVYIPVMRCASNRDDAKHKSQSKILNQLKLMRSRSLLIRLANDPVASLQRMVFVGEVWCEYWSFRHAKKCWIEPPNAVADQEL
jgi:hypothetical protein